MSEELCFQPWALTKMVCLCIGMTWIFTGIPFVVKQLVSTVEAVAYVIIVYFQFDFIIHSSMTSNPALNAELSHILFILLTWVFQYFMERDFEFNNKMNYQYVLSL